MPRSIKLGNEEEAQSRLQHAIASEEVQEFIAEGYVLSVTIVEIDDVSPNDTHQDVVLSAHETAGDLWQHETMVALGQFCSGTYKGRVNALYCWKYGDNRAMALDFSKTESDLGGSIPRFISRRTIEAEVIEYLVGTPTVSLGMAKSTEVPTSELMNKAQARVRKAKEQGKNQSVTEG